MKLVLKRLLFSLCKSDRLATSSYSASVCISAASSQTSDPQPGFRHLAAVLNEEEKAQDFPAETSINIPIEFSSINDLS